MKNIFFFLVGLLIVQLINGQEYAREQLENSPRHHEWVVVENGDRNIHCFVAYPEKALNTHVVVVIHENRGLNDWARSFADQVAAAGYMAIAPDLLSEFDDKHSKTTDFESSDAARTAIYQLDAVQVTKDLQNVIAYAKAAPASSGKVAVAGFCWGGSQSFRIASNTSDVEACLVFYGSAPSEPGAYEKVQAPVYGFYGENDQRINQGIPSADSSMRSLGKTYEYEIYHGAGHAYMRRGDDPAVNDDNTAARNKSWERINKILSGM